MSGKERSNPFCHHANRGGRKHTGKKRKLEIDKGVVNILQCNVTAWSEHARHYILTSDFDAALISETHLGREDLVTAAQLARTRTRWFSKPLSFCSDEAGILCSKSRLVESVIRVMGREILLLTAYFEHSVGFRSGIIANLMHDVRFLTRDGKLTFILGANVNFPPSFWQDLSIHGGSLWIPKLGASVVTKWVPHTRAVQAGVRSLTSSIIFWCQHSASDAKM